MNIHELKTLFLSAILALAVIGIASPVFADNMSNTDTNTNSNSNTNTNTNTNNNMNGNTNNNNMNSNTNTNTNTNNNVNNNVVTSTMNHDDDHDHHSIIVIHHNDIDRHIIIHSIQPSIILHSNIIQQTTVFVPGLGTVTLFNCQLTNTNQILCDFTQP